MSGFPAEVIAADYATLVRDGIVIWPKGRSVGGGGAGWLFSLSGLSERDGLRCEEASFLFDDIWSHSFIWLLSRTGGHYQLGYVPPPLSQPNQDIAAAEMRPQIERDWGEQLAIARQRAGDATLEMLIERLARTAAEPAQRGALDELTERGHADLKRRRGGGVGQPPKIVPLAALTTSTQAIWLAASYEHAYPTVALDYLQRGLSVASSDQERSAVLVARGEMLLRSGEVTVAFRTLAEAVALNPSFQENTSGYAAYLAAMREQARRSSNLAMRRDAIRLGDELLLAVPGAAGVWNTMGRLHADLIRHDLASAPASLRFLLEAERLGFERHELCYSLNQLWSRIRDVRDRAARSRRPDKSLVKLAEREMAQVDAQIVRLGFAPRPRGA